VRRNQSLCFGEGGKRAPKIETLRLHSGVQIGVSKGRRPSKEGAPERSRKRIGLGPSHKQEKYGGTVGSIGIAKGGRRRLRGKVPWG